MDGVCPRLVLAGYEARQEKAYWSDCFGDSVRDLTLRNSLYLGTVPTELSLARCDDVVLGSLGAIGLFLALRVFIRSGSDPDGDYFPL